MKKFSPIILLIVGLIFTKGSSFLENLILASVYGTSALSDSFILALTLPNTFFAVISMAVAQCYVPIYQKRFSNNFDLGNRFTIILMFCLAIVSVFVSVLIYFFIPSFVKILAPSASREVTNLACYIMKSLCWVSVIVFEMGVLQGFFQVKKNFLIVGMISVPINIGLTVSLIIGSINLVFLNIGIFITYFIQFIFFMFLAKKNGLVFQRFKITEYDFNILKEIFLLILPLLFGGLISDLSAIIDKAFASSFAIGVLSGMDYGNKVSGIIYALVSVPVITVFYPILSKYVNQNKKIESIYFLKKTIFYTMLVSIPILITVIVFSSEISYILFFRGKFDNNSLIITSTSLLLYTLSILPMTIRNIIEKMYLSNSNTSIVMNNAVITLLCNVIGNYFLSKIYGYKGLILATTLSFIFSIIFLLQDMTKRYGFRICTNEIKKITIIISETLCLLLLVQLFFYNIKYIFNYNVFINILILVFVYSIINIIFFGTLKMLKVFSVKKMVHFFKELR